MRSNILICARNNLILIKIADAATAAEREFKPSDYASEKLSGCVNEKRRREIILGDYVRGSLLLDASVEGETIALGHHGKPYLTDRSDVTFNVSHSGMLAVGIVATDAEGEVGIDVERIDRSRGEDRKNRIMRRAFTDAETAKIDSSRDPVAEFYAMWTKKEAYLKYTGEGITRPLVSVDTEARNLPCALRTFTVTGSDGEEYAIAFAVPACFADITPKIEYI